MICSTLQAIGLVTGAIADQGRQLGAVAIDLGRRLAGLIDQAAALGEGQQLPFLEVQLDADTIQLAAQRNAGAVRSQFNETQKEQWVSTLLTMF